MCFKTMRHIETVRNYLNTCIYEILNRAKNHDRSKLKTPEVEYFEKYVPILRSIKYGSDEYKDCLKKMQPAIDYHYACNRHHPEYFINGIKDMNLIDILEMFCDWKASSLRHETGDIRESIRINKERFGMSDELCHIFNNTATFLEENHIDQFE